MQLTLFTKLLILVFGFTMLTHFAPNNEHGYGTGFFITEYGDLVTAGHVCGSLKEVTVLVQGQMRKGTVLKKDRFEDVCFIHVPGIHTHYLGFRTKVDKEINIGIYGYPEVDIYGTDMKQSLGTGYKGFELLAGRTSFIYHAVAHPGNSGSPIVNESGQVVGELTNGLGTDTALYGYGTDSDVIVEEAIQLHLPIHYDEVDLNPYPFDQLKQDLITYDVVVPVIV